MTYARLLSVSSALAGSLLALSSTPAHAAPVAAPAEASSAAEPPATAEAPVETPPAASETPSDPAAEVPADRSAPAQPEAAQQSSTAPTSADLPLGATTPAYGLGVREVSVERGNGESYRLSPRRWEEHVEESPRLSRLQRRERMIIPGIVIAAHGGLWLTISTAVAIDRDRNGSTQRSLPALSATFQWIIPGALTATGVAMLVSGRAARLEIEGEQEEFYIAPTASRDSGGVVMGGRF